MSVYHVYLSCVFIMCVYNECLSCVFITCVYHVCLSRVFIMCVYHVCLSCVFHFVLNTMCVTWPYVMQTANGEGAPKTDTLCLYFDIWADYVVIRSERRGFTGQSFLSQNDSINKNGMYQLERVSIINNNKNLCHWSCKINKVKMFIILLNIAQSCLHLF